MQCPVVVCWRNLFSVHFSFVNGFTLNTTSISPLTHHCCTITRDQENQSLLSEFPFPKTDLLMLLQLSNLLLPSHFYLCFILKELSSVCLNSNLFSSWLPFLLPKVLYPEANCLILYGCIYLPNCMLYN